MSPSQGPHGFFHAFITPIAKKLDEKESQRRQDRWAIILDDKGTFSDAAKQEAWDALGKGLDPSNKKALGKFKDIFEKIGPALSKIGGGGQSRQPQGQAQPGQPPATGQPDGQPQTGQPQRPATPGAVIRDEWGPQGATPRQQFSPPSGAQGAIPGAPSVQGGDVAPPKPQNGTGQPYTDKGGAPGGARQQFSPPQPPTVAHRPGLVTQSERDQRARELETFKTDEEIRKAKVVDEGRRALQADKDQATKDLEALKAQHVQDLATLKEQNAKDLAAFEGTKAELAKLKADSEKQIEDIKAQAAKDIAALRAAQKPAKDASVAGGTVPDLVASKYTPGGKSIANPTGNMTIDTGAWDYLETGHLPYTGMGGGAKGAKNARELMVGRAGELLADMGLTGADLPAIRGKIKGDTSALARVTTMGALVQQFESTLSANMKVAQKLSEEWARGDYPAVNRVAAAFKTGTGSTEALNLAAQLHGVAREWGKIMQGSVSASGVQISEANATDELFNKGITNGQLASFMQNVIIPDIKNRTAAIEGEKQALVGQLRSDVSLNSAGAPQQSSGSATVHYTEGPDSYDIPADKVTAFEKAHPKAKKQ